MKVHVSFDIDASKLADLAALLGGMDSGSLSVSSYDTVSSSAPVVTGALVTHIATQTAQEAPQAAQETIEEDDWSETLDAPAETPEEAPAAPEAASEAPATTAVAVNEAVLRAKSLAELRAICETNGVPVPPKKTKDGYIRAIFDHFKSRVQAVTTEVAPSPEVPAADEWDEDAPAAESNDGWDEESTTDEDLWAEDPAA